MKPVTLASRSPQRLALLRQIGIVPRVRPVAIDEEAYFSLHPSDVRAALFALANAKADAARAASEEGVIIAADTVITFQGATLGKPRDALHAREMLTALSGATHAVYTAVAVVDAVSNARVCDIAESAVTFLPLSDDRIARYVATGEPFGKAGAYGIQGKGALLVQEISGSYSNIVGLPLSLLGVMLARFDIPCF